MFFEKLADFIIKRSKLIFAIWIVALLIAIPFAVQSGSVMQYDMTKMSSSKTMESQIGTQILKEGGFNSEGSINGGSIIVVEVLDSQAANVADALTENLTYGFYFWDYNKDLRDTYGRDYQVNVNKIGSFDDKYFQDKDTQMLIYSISYPELPDGTKIKANNCIAPIRGIVNEAKEGIDGIIGSYVTGSDAIAYDTMTGAVSDVKKIDPVSILLILILIGLFFRSFITAATPPIIIGMAYGILLAFVFGIGSVIGIFYITTILVLVSMLGAGCDYCIFIVSRYREERKECKDHIEALRESIIWAGESIVTSGISVIIGFGSMMICSFSLVQTMGLILALGVLFALLAALTFIPSLIAVLGDRIFWPSKIDSYMEGSKAMNGWYGKCAAFGQRYFANSAHMSIKYAKVIFVVAILLTVPLAYVAISSNSSYDMISAMPDGEAKQGVGIISDNIGGGMIMPTTVTMKVDAFVDVSDNMIYSGTAVQSGTKVQFVAEPYTGYELSGWFVNGVWTPALYDTHTITATANTDVKAVFVKSEYSVEFSATGNGKVSGFVNDRSILSGETAYYGNNIKFIAQPDAGYHVAKWVVSRDGDVTTDYVRDTEYEIDCCSYDYVVEAVFEQDTDVKYTVNFTIPDGPGSVSVRADGVQIESGAQVPAGSYLKAYAMPDKGYTVKEWKVNGTSSGVLSTIDIGPATADTTIEVTYKPVAVKQYKVIFASVGDGAVTATANGTEIHSGDMVSENSKVIIKAAPNGSKIVQKWTFSTNFPVVGPVDMDSYVSKTQHTIPSLQNDTTITVTFGENVPVKYTVNFTQPANGNLIASTNGTPIENGEAVNAGSPLFFKVIPDDGYCVKNWIINSVDVGSTNNTYSIGSIMQDMTVEPVLEPVSNVMITFSSTEPLYGNVTAVNASPSAMYSERSNASVVFAGLNEFTKSLMSLQTNGVNNVAVAIGPINGDLLFDGEHEWIFNTIFDILPKEYKTIAGLFCTYDLAVALWHSDLIDYQLRQTIDYALTYKLGFVSAPFCEKEGGNEYQYVKFMVMTKEQPMSKTSVETIKQIYSARDAFMSENSPANGGFAYAGYLSGAAVSNYEVSELVNHDFSIIIMVVIVLLIILLFVVMRSYLTPIRAVLTIVMSVLWTLGLTYLIFDMMLGRPVVWIVPIVLFVICLGLGMDYDILLTTRIKECVSKGMSNDEAIVAAVEKSGAVITLCGLIMAGAFGTMMLSSSPMLMEFGFALGFAIAIDALIIRTYIVPAIMHLMGDWNWKGPKFERRKKKSCSDE